MQLILEVFVVVGVVIIAVNNLVNTLKIWSLLERQKSKKR